jgi:hypothetical protein
MKRIAGDLSYLMAGVFGLAMVACLLPTFVCGLIAVGWTELGDWLTSGPYDGFKDLDGPL